MGKGWLSINTQWADQHRADVEKALRESDASVPFGYARNECFCCEYFKSTSKKTGNRNSGYCKKHPKDEQVSAGMWACCGLKKVRPNRNGF